MLAENLSDLFQRHLEFAYDTERQLLKELPKIAEAVSSADLKKAIEQHMEQTKRHVERIEKVFSILKRAPAAETSHVIHNISGEINKMIDHIEPSPLRDAAIISNANQVEHYEIALYGSLSSFAQALGLGRSCRFAEADACRRKSRGPEAYRHRRQLRESAGTRVHQSSPRFCGDLR